jgi:hypothetical protein
MAFRSGTLIPTNNIPARDFRFYEARIKMLAKALEGAEKIYFTNHNTDALLALGLFQPKIYEEVEKIILSEESAKKESLGHYLEYLMQALESLPGSGIPLFEVKGM